MELETRTRLIYNFLKLRVLLGMIGSPPLSACFSDQLAEEIHGYYKGFEKVDIDEVDLVDVATDHPEKFDVYFTRYGYYGDPSFVICKKGLSIPQIWKALKIQDDTSLDEFYYHLFRVDKDGNASDTAIAKEFNLPKYAVFGPLGIGTCKKYSYNRNEKPYFIKNYYKTIDGLPIDTDRLDQFKDLPQNYNHTDWSKLHQELCDYFGISDEEAEDIMINYFEYPLVESLTEKVRKPIKCLENAYNEEKEELFSMTPYMLRNDGALLTCGELHPYIKMSNTASYETNLKTLNSHPDFLDWFYDNTLNEETKELIKEFKKEPDEELMNLLNDLTNQEFCRVRTSNYKVKYGGDNGQIYFRISSTGFNWFDLIWNIVSKFSKDIKEVTVMKDKQTFGGKEFDYYYNHLPTDQFLTLKGNPIVEGK